MTLDLNGTVVARVVSPPVNELASLRQPLTQGELHVFEYFNNHLDEEWEI